MVRKVAGEILLRDSIAERSLGGREWWPLPDVIDRRDRGVSLGPLDLGAGIRIPTRPELSPVPPPRVTAAPRTVPAPVQRPVPAPIVVPKKGPLEDLPRDLGKGPVFDDGPYAWPAGKPVNDIPPPQRWDPPATQTVEDKPVGLDLGTIISDVAGTYIRQRWGSSSGGGGFTPPIYAGPALLNEGVETVGGGIPGVDVIPEPPTEDTKGWVFKKHCGQWRWVKQRRRRRRKLLTDQDYNGLLKVQTLKNTDNMKVAIAKALGR